MSKQHFFIANSKQGMRYASVAYIYLGDLTSLFRYFCAGRQPANDEEIDKEVEIPATVLPSTASPRKIAAFRSCAWLCASIVRSAEAFQPVCAIRIEEYRAPVRSYKIAPPLHAEIVGFRQEAARKTARTHSVSIAAAPFRGRRKSEFQIEMRPADSRRLFEQVHRGRSEEKKTSICLPFTASLVDDAAQLLKDLRRAVYLIQNHQLVVMICEVLARSESLARSFRLQGRGRQSPAARRSRARELFFPIGVGQKGHSWNVTQ